MLKRLINSLTSPFDEAIAQPDDPDDVRLGKRLFVRFHLFLVIFTLLLTIQGILIADRTFAQVIFLIFITFFTNMVLLRRSGRFQVHFSIFVLFTMVVPFLTSAIFGGFNANAPNLWVSFSPLLLVVLVLDQREIIRWFLFYFGLTECWYGVDRGLKTIQFRVIPTRRPTGARCTSCALRLVL